MPISPSTSAQQSVEGSQASGFPASDSPATEDEEHLLEGSAGLTPADGGVNISTSSLKENQALEAPPVPAPKPQQMEVKQSLETNERQFFWGRSISHHI